MKREPLETRLLSFPRISHLFNLEQYPRSYGSENLTLLQIVTAAFNAWIKCVFMLLQWLLGLNSRDPSIFLEYLGGYTLKGWSCNGLDSRRVIVLILSLIHI